MKSVYPCILSNICTTQEGSRLKMIFALENDQHLKSYYVETFQKRFEDVFKLQKIKKSPSAFLHCLPSKLAYSNDPSSV